MVFTMMRTMFWAPFLHVLDGAVFAHVKNCGVKVPMVTVMAVIHVTPTVVVLNLILNVCPPAIITQQIEDILHISFLHGRFTSAV
jgi:hypothetical protein